MASKRRGGFRPPELRGTLGTLIRTTTGVVRDALQRGAREGRARLDGARASRRRHDALADLGELVLDLIRRGEIDLAELPEARDAVRELDELDEADHLGAAAEPEPPRPAARRRFDDRPPAAPPPRRAAPAAGGGDGDDGTVSSGAALRAERPTLPDRSRPGETPSTRAPTRPIKTAWRPHSDNLPLMNDHRGRVERWDAQRTAPIGRGERGGPSERGERPRPEAAEREAVAALVGRARAESTEREAEPSRPDADPRDDERERPEPRPVLAHDPSRKGGISFDDDDLAEYMHPDDVPPRPPAKDPDDRDP